MEIVARSREARGAHFLFSAFAEKERLVGLGDDPHDPDGEIIWPTLMDSPSSKDLLKYDKALIGFVNGGLLRQSYRFECPNCGEENDVYGDNNPPGEDQVCRRASCNVPYDEIKGILWDAESLLSSKDVQNASITMFVEFVEKKMGIPLSYGFVNEYVELLGGVLHDQSVSVGDYTVSINANNANKMKETGGLIKKLTFSGHSNILG